MNTKQWKDEPVLDYINCWRVLAWTANIDCSKLLWCKCAPKAQCWTCFMPDKWASPKLFKSWKLRCMTQRLDIQPLWDFFWFCWVKEEQSWIQEKCWFVEEFRQRGDVNLRSWAGSHYGKAETGREKERTFIGYYKEASHTKRAPGEKISILWLRLRRNARWSS